MSKKQFKVFGRKNRNSSSKKANIFGLSQSIKRSVISFEPYSDNNDNLRFAEACLLFLEHKHPEKLKELKFYPDANLATLIGELANTITSGSLNYIIKNDSQDGIVRDPNNYKLEFLMPFNIDWVYYVMDIPTIWKLPEPLRIGYAFLLNQMQASTSFENDFFVQQYNNETILDGLEIKDLCEEFGKTKRQIKQLFKRYTFLINRLNEYCVKDINIFLNYKPKSQRNKDLLFCLQTIYEIGFSPFHKFGDNFDYYENGTSSYSDLITPVIDRNDYFGKYFIGNKENHLNNNGITYPCKVTEVDNGKIVEWHTDDNVIEFYELIKTLEKLETLLNN